MFLTLNGAKSPSSSGVHEPPVCRICSAERQRMRTKRRDFAIAIRTSERRPSAICSNQLAPWLNGLHLADTLYRQSERWIQRVDGFLASPSGLRGPPVLATPRKATRRLRDLFSVMSKGADVGALCLQEFLSFFTHNFPSARHPSMAEPEPPLTFVRIFKIA